MSTPFDPNSNPQHHGQPGQFNGQNNGSSQGWGSPQENPYGSSAPYGEHSPYSSNDPYRAHGQDSNYSQGNNNVAYGNSQPYGGYNPQQPNFDQSQFGQTPAASSSSKLPLIIVAIVAVVGLIGFAAYWFATGESRAVKSATKGIEKTMAEVSGTDTLVGLNTFVCDTYKADEAKLKKIDDSMAASLMGGVAPEGALTSELPTVDNSTVELVDGKKDTATLASDGQTMTFVKNGDQWQICDPEMNMKDVEALAGVPGFGFMGDFSLKDLEDFGDSLALEDPAGIWPFDSSKESAELDQLMKDLESSLSDLESSFNTY